jgi:hypothetical protein
MKRKNIQKPKFRTRFLTFGSLCNTHAEIHVWNSFMNLLLAHYWAVHKVRQHFFAILTPPSPIASLFLYLIRHQFFLNFWPLGPPHKKSADVIYGWSLNYSLLTNIVWFPIHHPTPKCLLASSGWPLGPSNYQARLVTRIMVIKDRWILAASALTFISSRVSTLLKFFSNTYAWVW